MARVVNVVGGPPAARLAATAAVCAWAASSCASIVWGVDPRLLAGRLGGLKGSLCELHESARAVRELLDQQEVDRTRIDERVLES